MQYISFITFLSLQAKSSTLFAKQPVNFALRLPDGWRSIMPLADQVWMGRHVFAKKGIPTDPAKHWHHAPEKHGPKKPVAGEYFLRPLYLWMPRLAYMFQFKCSHCGNNLRCSIVVD